MRTERPNPSREGIFSGASGDGKMNFPVQLATQAGLATIPG